MRRLLILFLTCVVAAESSGSCPVCTVPGTVGDFASQNTGLTVPPVGNAWPTGGAFAVQGTTSKDDLREFLVTLGMNSKHGNHSRPSPYHDKVVLYTGMSAQPGTGDVWSINPLLTQEPGSGDYNAQGIELDFNNNNAHRGDVDAGGGLAPPVSYGLSVTGAGNYRSTSAVLVCGKQKMWNRGITFANDAVAQSTFQDLGNPEKSVDIRGSPTYGVYQSSASSKNLFAGKTGIATGVREPTAELEVGGDIHFSGSLLRKTTNGALHPVLLGSAAGGDQKVLSGNSVLGDQGSSKVHLNPSELGGASLSAYDVSYTLTAIGAPMPSLHVASELGQEGSTLHFEVAGGVAGKRVSWLLVLNQKNSEEMV